MLTEVPTRTSSRSRFSGPCGRNAPEEPIAGKVQGSRYDWSPDGRWIAFGKYHHPQPMDLWVLPLFGDRKPFPFLETPFEKGSPRFSSDGKWISYVSNESGRYEVYARAFRGTEGVTDRQITDGLRDTLLIGEVTDAKILWTKPEDIEKAPPEAAYPPAPPPAAPQPGGEKPSEEAAPVSSTVSGTLASPGSPQRRRTSA